MGEITPETYKPERKATMQQDVLARLDAMIGKLSDTYVPVRLINYQWDVLYRLDLLTSLIGSGGGGGGPVTGDYVKLVSEALQVIKSNLAISLGNRLSLELNDGRFADVLYNDDKILGDTNVCTVGSKDTNLLLVSGDQLLVSVGDGDYLDSLVFGSDFTRLYNQTGRVIKKVIQEGGSFVLDDIVECYILDLEFHYLLQIDLGRYEIFRYIVKNCIPIRFVINNKNNPNDVYVYFPFNIEWENGDDESAVNIPVGTVREYYIRPYWSDIDGGDHLCKGRYF